MTQTTTHPHLHDHYLECGAHIISHDATFSDIGVWLQKGFDDMIAAPLISLFYGLIMASLVMGVFLAYQEQPFMIFKIATFFVMLSPFLAVGLYYVSKQLQLQRSPKLMESIMAWRFNTAEIAMYALVLGVVIAIWSRITPLLAAIVESETLLIVNSQTGINGILTSEAGLAFMVTFFIAAALISAFVFSISVITLPLLLKDKNVGVVSAMILSYQVVMENKKVMAAWALTIGALLVTGLLTLGIAMLFVMPLLGYASWHAFEQLIEFDETQPRLVVTPH